MTILVLKTHLQKSGKRQKKIKWKEKKEKEKKCHH